MKRLIPGLLSCFLATCSIAAAAPAAPENATTRPAPRPAGAAWTPEAIQKRIRLLEHGSDAERRNALHGLLVGMVTPEFRRPLLTIIRDEDADIRTRIMAAQRLIYYRRFATPEDLEAAVRILCAAMTHEDPEVREGAIEYIRGAGPAQRLAAAGILRLIEGAPEGELRRELMETVIDDGDEHAGVHPQLAEALSPGLQKLLHAPDREVAVTAHAVLRFVDPEAVPSPAPVRKHVPYYIDRLKEDDPEEGPDALVRLYEIGPEAAEAIPEIVRFVIRNRDSDLVKKGGLYVGSLPFFFGEAALPELLKLLDDDNDAVVCLAAVFIGNARRTYSDAVPELIELSRARDGERQACIVRALASVGREDERVARVLRSFLDNTDADVRRAAVSGLAWQAPSDANLAAIEPLTLDPDDDVRSAATYTREHLEVRRGLAAESAQPSP